MKLVVLAHRHDTLAANYMPTLLAPLWRRDGLEVEFVQGTDRFVPADAAMLHVDMTDVPAAYVKLAARYPLVINGAFTDIAKRGFSDRRVRWPWAPRGPVIVKTDRNHGGVPERLKAVHGIARRLAQIGDRLPWWVSGRFDGHDYPIYESPSSVPLAAWLHPRLLVERLVNERRGDLYVSRRWYFLGTRDVSVVYATPDPRPGTAANIDRDYTQPIPDALRAWRRRFALGFGKIDYAIVEGRAVVYDINRTPNIRRWDEPAYAHLLAHLAPGIWDLLPRG